MKIPTTEYRIGIGEFNRLKEFGISIILDVGANVGKSAIMMIKIIDNVVIYSFEPIGKYYTELLNNTKSIDCIKCFNVVRRTKTGIGTIFHNDFSPSSSLLEMNSLYKTAFPHTQRSIKEQIKLSTLDDLHNLIEWKEKTLLKIDVQGYELEVLEGAEYSLMILI